MNSKQHRMHPCSTGMPYIPHDRIEIEMLAPASLNGDYNPLHAVPEVGLKMGLAGVILHVLFTYSSTCQRVVQKMCNGDASRLKSFQARFASPVKPGDRLVTTIWRMGIDRGLKEIRFTTRNQDDKVVLSNERALFVPKRDASRL